jgi:hypothetical protein
MTTPDDHIEMRGGIVNALPPDEVIAVLQALADLDDRMTRASDPARACAPDARIIEAGREYAVSEIDAYLADTALSPDATIHRTGQSLVERTAAGWSVRSFAMRIAVHAFGPPPLSSSAIGWIGWVRDDFVAGPDRILLSRREAAPWHGEVLARFAAAEGAA